MTIMSLNHALKAIRKGRASDVLAKLLKWRIEAPFDLATCYVYAYALEKAGHTEKASEVWRTSSKLQAEQPQTGKIPIQPLHLNKYTDELEIELLSILMEGETDIRIRQMLAQLNAAPRPGSVPMGQAILDDLVELENDSTIISDTFGRILATQKKYAEAAAVYRRLAEQNPERREIHIAEASRLSRLAKATGGK